MQRVGANPEHHLSIPHSLMCKQGTYIYDLLIALMAPQHIVRIHIQRDKITP